jgi:hypothetical protein
MKVMIDPNCVLPDDMTQEELDDMLKDFQEMVDNGTLEENSKPVTEEEYAELVAYGYISDEEITRH